VETFSIYNPHSWGPAAGDIDIPVRWKRREWGGWTLVHAKTGRNLGWIVRDTDDSRAWAIRLCSQAFRGDEHADGDILDVVPARLYDGDPHNSLASHCVNTVRTRWEAAHVILSMLVRRAAPAVGFPRHPQVDTSRSDRYRKAMAA
jgi:hypothetical protein